MIWMIAFFFLLFGDGEYRGLAIADEASPTMSLKLIFKFHIGLPFCFSNFRRAQTENVDSRRHKMPLICPKMFRAD